MANRQIYLALVEDGIRAVCDLYWEHAPVTCETLWQATAEPIRETAVHAMFAGPEIMTGLPASAQTFDPTSIPTENQTCFPGRGELLWFYQGKNVMKGLTDELWEVGVFYDHGGRTFGPLGWTPCNMFGTVVENHDRFAAACRDIRISGAKTLEIGRA